MRGEKRPLSYLMYDYIFNKLISLFIMSNITKGTASKAVPLLYITLKNYFLDVFFSVVFLVVAFFSLLTSMDATAVGSTKSRP